MLLEKSHFYKIAIILLLIIDLFFCFYCMTKATKDADNYDMFKDSLYDYCLASASIDPISIKEMIDRNISINLEGEVSTVGVLVPPHPCGACVNKELDILISNPLMSDGCIILTPSNLYRDIRAKVNNNNVIIEQYDTDEESNPSIEMITGVLYFLYSDGSLSDYYISNEWVPEATMHFLSNNVKYQKK